MSKQPRKEEGIVFPLTEKGDRATTLTAKKIFSASISSIYPEGAKNIENEKNWRNRYNKYILENVRQSLGSYENALNASKAGLDYMYKNFEFIRGDKIYKFGEAMETIKDQPFSTGVVKGTKPKPSSYEFVVPYKGKDLKGEELISQLRKWAQYGTIEPSAEKAIAEIATNKKFIDLSDSYFVLLGAGAAMGPFSVLMSLGANVIALDIDRPGVWERLIKTAKNSSGTLIFPLKKDVNELKEEDYFNHAGANLMTQAPEILNWLRTVEKDKRFIVGCYVYLDGENHVKVALACDAIMKGLCEAKKDTVLAYLCTPTDAHVVPKEAHQAAEKNYNESSLINLLLTPIKMLSGGKYLVKNAERSVVSKNGEEFHYIDGLVVAQGPNYALAKRLQHWRAMVAHSNGHTVSSNVAPATSTASVVHNRQFAWAYGGMPYFKPMEIFQQETSNAVMAALLIYDFRNTNSVANPSNKLRNPLELFSQGGFHGGLWRTGYKFNTIGETAVLLYFINQARPYLLILLGILVAFFLKRFF